MVSLLIQSMALGLMMQAGLGIAQQSALTSCLTNAKVPVASKGSPDATAYNYRVPIAPAAVAVPTTVAQISAAVSCGARNGVAVNAKSGSHSYTSLGFGGEDGHLVVELDKMHSVKVNSNDGTAKIQGGARLGHVATELYKQGKRALSHGTCPGVGVGGLALHGGYGAVSNKYGLTVESIIGATVVLANGTSVHCSDKENNDLFWAIRGAGPSFGIIAEFEFKTFPAPEKNTYFEIDLPFTQKTAAQGLFDVQEFGKTMPAELMMQAYIAKTGYALTGGYVGDEAALRKAVQPLLTKLGAKMTAKTVGWMDLVKYNAGVDNVDITDPDYNEHETSYASSLLTQALTLGDFKSLVDFLHTTGAASARSWWMHMDLYGGQNSAITKPKSDAMAYVHRDELLLWQLKDPVPNGSKYPSDGFALLKGIRNSITKGLKTPWGMYANYPDSEIGADEAARLYWGKNLPRLQQIKTQYDPGNVFRSTQSVKPVGKA